MDDRRRPAAARGRGGGPDQRNGDAPAPITPALTLPKGGGAIRGIGEKFAANPVTGTGSMSVPIPTSPSRSGSGPQLAIVYDSGAGNGPFGFGWSLSLPSITRKTDKGLPRYRDAEDSDVFVLSGSDDLVPMLDDIGDRVVDDTSVSGYTITRFRPRTEGSFARIEKWMRQSDGDVHWRTLSADNVLSVYGADGSSRIAHPTDPARIFTWLLCETRDDRGNAMIVEYKAEDAVGVDIARPEEVARGDSTSPTRSANRYLKRVRYGNRLSLLDAEGRRPVHLDNTALANADWMFEVVLDYGEHDADAPTPNDAGAWLCRNDPFSVYRAGFEVRTYRLCQRVLVFHHFPREAGVGADCLVRSVDLEYRESRGIAADRRLGNPVASFIASVTQRGYTRNNGGGYDSKAYPPISFEYTDAVISASARAIDADSVENLPAGLADSTTQLIDLDGEGLPGILTEQADAWHYKRNLGQGQFGPLERVSTRPSLAKLSRGQQALIDLAGDGTVDLVELQGEPAGFFERSDEEGWKHFIPFTSRPNVDWPTGNVQLVDLTGDGRADLLITDDGVFTWHESLGEAGFGEARRIAQPLDEESGPHLVLADGTQTVFLADMTGDGLADIVRIRNGEMCYWPNLGYGRFGARITMSGAPWFDAPERFDPRRIRLGDVDGSGVVDIVYVGDGEIRLWFNESGNGWSAAHRLPDFPHVDDYTSVQLADLLGNGTACLVWSSPLPRDAGRSLQYIDLMGGTKPHLLQRVVNNCGAEARVCYAASTAFYVADRAAGRPWITRLPFPVHVVERVEHVDHVSRTRFACRYSYHHGYFDGDEREFRGFAMVEQHDVEAFEDYVAGIVHLDGTQELAPELWQPPVTTRTWFHTGAYLEGTRILHQLRGEYYQQQQHVPEPVLPEGMSDTEYRQAVRAMRGLPLRQEVYSFDGSANEEHPYSVVENTYEVRRLQPRVGETCGVFLAFPRESIAHSYERTPADPRVTQSVVLDVGPYGNVLSAASITYGRKTADGTLPPEVKAAQERLHITHGESAFTNDIDRSTPVPAYRLRVACEARSFEITGLSPATSFFTRGELQAAITAATPIDYEVVANGASLQKRLLSHHRSIFRNDALAALPFGELDSLGVVYESYRLAFTPGVTAAHYAGHVTDSEFVAAGYVHLGGDGNWWIPSGIALYPDDPAAHFYMPHGTRDALGLQSIAVLDQYDLLTERTAVVGAAWTETRVVNDYRVLGPVLITDPNQNRTAVEIDALGLVVKSAVMGKEGEGEGDTLADPTARFAYDLFQWMTHGQPNVAHVFARERHGDPNTRWQESYVYSNGSGTVAMLKVRTKPGLALRVTDDGTVEEVDADPRWIGNGRVVLNNKGNPVKRYEPYFSTTHEYEDEPVVREIGTTPILYYDAVGRNIRTELANGTIARVEFDAWMQRAFDVNDTVRESVWYLERGSPDPVTDPEPLADEEKRAAWLAAKHAGTPSSTYFDSLGRAIHTVSDCGNDRTCAIRSELDLTGRYSRVFDQHEREVARGFTGMAGTAIYSSSAEKGSRWTFLNALGTMVKSWNEQGRSFRIEYDELHRVTSSYATESAGPEILFTHVVYGDRHPQAVALNLLGIAHQVFEPAGMVRIPALDFKGNPTSVERVLARDYTQMPDWGALPAQSDYDAIQTAAAPSLETAEPFVATSDYDALSRPTEVTLHGGTVITPTYAEGGMLASLQALIDGIGEPVDFLKRQDYDAKGQRQFAHYGNDLVTRYFYDPKTYRLTDLVTTPLGEDPVTKSVQRLHYTYDPVGNVTCLRDDAQQTYFFQNAVVQALSRFEYDALYHLTKATGREHARATNDSIRDDRDIDFAPEIPDVNDAGAVRTYTEQYEYDLLGNILSLRHQTLTAAGNWTRRYRYAYQDDPNDATNRLSATSRPGDPDAGPYTATYDYDVYGNMTRLRTPNPGELTWNILEQLERVDLGGGGTAFYVYGTGGHRVRKVIEHVGSLRTERIYLGALEIYRERMGSNPPHLERHTLHIADGAGRIAQVDIKTRDDDGADPSNPLGVPLIRYQYGNLLGSATLETDEQGLAISYEEYHPFGTTAYRSSKSGVNLSLKRYRFTGKERDDETGLYYFGARYYAPWLGRWTAADPAGFVSGFNLFRYCANNPVTLRDPNGMKETQHITTKGGTEAATKRLNKPTADPHEVLKYFQTHGHAELTNAQLPRWDPSIGMWRFPELPPAPERPPVSEAITAIQEGARPTASMNPSPVGRTRVGASRTFTPGEGLEGPYQLWSNEAGGGLQSAASKPGFIMEDTEFEDAAEAAARRMGFSGRYDPEIRNTPGAFEEIWHPASDSAATRAGLSQIGVESNGIDPASVARNPGYDPSRSVQLSREIPRIRAAGGAMAGLGAASGALTIWAASQVENTAVRYFGYAAGALEIAGALRFAQGLTMLGTAGSGAVMTQGMMLGRFAGGAGAVALSTYSLAMHLDQGRYDVVLGDSAGIVGGVAVLAGAGPVAAIAGGIALANAGGDLIERKWVEGGGSHGGGVAAATAAGAIGGAAIGAAIGVWFFGVGIGPGAAIGAAVGGAAAFIGAYW